MNISYQTFGRRDWNGWQRYPELGAAFIHVNFGEGAHGRGVGIVPNLAVPIVFRENWEVKFRLGSGLGRIEKPFDYIKNPGQNAIGSRWNNITQFRLTGKWRPMGGRLAVMGGGVFTHFSNGGARRPNFGLNLPGLLLGAQWSPVLLKKSAFLPAKIPKRPPLRRWGGLAQVGISYAEVQVEGGPVYPIYSASGAVARYFSKTNRGFIGLDWERHDGIMWFLAHAKGVADEREFRPAATRWLAWAGDEFLFGPLGVHVQMGINLSRESELVPFFLYNKLAFRYYLPGIAGGPLRPWAGIYLKSHKITAEYISLAAGVAF